MSAKTHIRFRGDKKETWKVTALNQIGPDKDVGSSPDGTPYQTFRPTNCLYKIAEFENEEMDVLLVSGLENVSDDALVGKHAYCYHDDRWAEITANKKISADVMRIEIDDIFDSEYPPPPEAQGVKIAIFKKRMITVANRGNDSNSGTPLYPKRTIQAAIDAAVAKGYSLVQILDSGTYEECLDLKGVSIEARAGETPTIRFPVSPFQETAHGIDSRVRQIAKFTYNGEPCLYAAADDGLYRSMTGKSWEKEHLVGHMVVGCCVWRDELYVASHSDGAVYVVNSNGAITLFADRRDNKIDNDTFDGCLYALGSKLHIEGDTDAVSGVWFDGSSWSDEIETGFLDQIIYDPSISDRYAYGRSLALDGSFCVIDTETKDKKYYYSIKPTSLAAHNGRLYVTTRDGIFQMASPSCPDTWIPVVTKAPWSNGSPPRQMYWDTHGACIVITDTNVFISRNNFLSFEKYDCASGILTGFFDFFGVDVAATATGITVWDRCHLRSDTPAEVRGIILDGQSLALNAYAGYVGFTWSRIGDYARLCEAGTARHAYSRFESMLTVSMPAGNDATSSFEFCEIVAAKNIGFLIDKRDVHINDCSIVANNYGLVIRQPCIIKRTIISGNAVDVIADARDASFESCCCERLQGDQVSNTRPLEGISFGNPLFVDDSGRDLTLKSRALGCALDSALLKDVNSDLGVDVRENMGARRFSRVLVTSEYGLDYTLHCNPATIRNAYRPANYTKAYAQNGSMYGGETNPSSHKLARTLSWDGTGGEDATTKMQAAMLRYIYGLDSVLEVGDSSNGTDFVPKRVGEKVSTFERVSFGANDPMIAPNEHAGAWCTTESGDTIGRIDSHTKSYLVDGVYVIDITWQPGTDLPAVANICKIDCFRQFRIDKSQPFSPLCQMPYVPGVISDIPTQYELTLEEVDE